MVAMLYELPSLPYGYDALEPLFDAKSLELHHAGHHAEYVRRLNDALTGRPNLAKLSLEEIIEDIRKMPEDIRQDLRNNGGGHLNHSLFWHIIGPDKGGEPAGTLMDAIVQSFGSFKAFRTEFGRLSMERFGSGWSWLAVDGRGRLEVITTANQDSPIMMGCRPVLGLDLWEHSYYLRYPNRKADYIAAWWQMVDWQRVAELYEHCVEWAGRAR
jgi:Fe-Mn family superoxide dismutase